MHTKSARWNRATICIHILALMLTVMQAVIPEAFAFGPLFGGALGSNFRGGGFGGGAPGGGGFNQGGYPGQESPGYSGGGAGQMFIYPSHGQSPQQEQYDKGQ